jgi:hypothetical protein
LNAGAHTSALHAHHHGTIGLGGNNKTVFGEDSLLKVVIERGATRGFSYKQLWKAKDALGVEDFREKGLKSGPSHWALPQHVPPDTQEPKGSGS